ncbi:hypothetical protein EAH78_28980 [Pseudomonas arsenicoxydans]|uniref:Uncharacterized protein n=1 Tax=Pseudomonas arsenicoxydans TaxID=702115 RepID=A0A502H2P3_9PSED|nr:hypothetical protein EAH78_28980 [Pseudomonas arsenicoxydans]
MTVPGEGGRSRSNNAWAGGVTLIHRGGRRLTAFCAKCGKWLAKLFEFCPCWKVVPFFRAPSRASPLPHSTEFCHENAVECGSGLAREGFRPSAEI